MKSEVVNFNLIEGDYNPNFPYDTVKKEYRDGLPVKEIRKKHGLNNGQWSRFLKELKSEGFPLRGDNPRFYIHDKTRRMYKVERVINGKRVFFGYFKTEEEAQARVKQLKENNWEDIE